MTTVHFSAHQCHIGDLVEGDAPALASFRAINGLSHSSFISTGRAYTFDLDHPDARAIISTLNMQPPESRALLSKIAADQGPAIFGDMAFYERYLSDEALAKVMTMVGAGSAAGGARGQQLDGFHRALLEYQNALLGLQQAAPGMPGSGARQAQATQRIHAAYNALEQHYARALAELAPPSLRHSNRGSALSNARRGITLARRSRGRHPDPRLQVGDQYTAHRLDRYLRHLQHTGRAAVALDAGLRGNKVHTVHDAGGNWHRESVVQIGGFVAGAASGAAVGYVLSGAAAGILAGPIGWAVLGVLAVTTLAVYIASSAGAEVGEALGNHVYDRITSLAP